MPAAEDLERIYAWIERENSETARRVAKIIYDGCGQLKDFPNMGRASCRFPPLPPLPYVAVYQVKENAVEISRIFHGAQDWP